jgi:Tfp pilus tip-associated adhesin PilY1
MNSLLRFLSRTVFATLLALCLVPAQAVDLVGDDTDLFMVNPNIPVTVPNVLIILDNTSNWSAQSQNWPSTIDPVCSGVGITGNQQGDAEVCAIYKVIGNLTDQVNVGLMMFNDQDKGAYVRFPLKPMDDTWRPLLQSALTQISTNDSNDKTASNSSYDNPMNDAFRYYNSFATMGGANAASSQADGTAYTNPSTKTQFQLVANPNNICGNDYIIFIGNGFPNSVPVSPAIDSAAALLNDPNVVVNKTVVQNTGVNADIWARFLFDYGVKVSDGKYRSISTHTVDVCRDNCNTNQEILLRKMADVSAGSYYQTKDLSQIEAALKEIFQKVQAVNTVFAATTLPVSINVRGTNLNQVYIGVFRPDGNRSPRWLGNLKHYKLGVKDAAKGQLELRDANDVAAVNLQRGFIFNTATSIWTQDSTFWSFRTPFEPTDVGQESDEPDGDVVEKGGAAQKIRQVYDFPDASAAQTRKLYTCTGACNGGSQLKDFLFNSANADITAQELGTFLAKSVTSITASGATATATVAGGNTFVAGDIVVVAGAVPNVYNGTFTVLGSPAPTASTFSYTVSPAPDATKAYATQPGYALVPGTDRVTVTGATPAEYNAPTPVVVEAVVGSPNQFAYPISGSPSSAASGYTVTGHRRIPNGNLVWSSTTFEITATLPNHGYNSGDVVSVYGANETEFNVPGMFSSGFITRVDNNTFTYAPNGFPASATVTSAVATTADPNTGANPFSWNAGDRVRVTNGGSSNFNTPTTPAPTGANITNLSGNTFTYATSGTVSGSAVGVFTAERVFTTDKNTWTISGASVSGSAITLTLTGMQNLLPGQLPHPFVATDPITVNNVICRRSNGNIIPCVTGAAAGATSFTATVSSANNSGVTTVTVTFPADSTQIATFTINSPGNTLVWSASANSPTFSKAVTINTLAAGEATVTASGTVFVTKPEDLTSKVTSISSGAVATGTITAALASSGDPAERDKVIAWMRGMDNRDDENENSDATDIRASVHGDVLHSRPAVVNYNRNGDDNDVFVFYGGNDGLLHVVKGGSAAAGGGKEQWAFVPTEFFGKLKRLREQAPAISSLTPRDYFFDGPMGVYTLDRNKDGKIEALAGDKVYLFIAMRRGGRMIYALDVSDPADPKFMWKRGCREATGNGSAAGSGGCDVGFGEIGQAWSEPKLGYLRKWPDTLALMFAAGYDAAVEDPQACFVTGWDATSVTYKAGLVPPSTMNATTCGTALSGGTSKTTNRTMGRGIFILNALTGDILWRAGPESGATRPVASMTYAMPGDLAVLRNRHNTANRATDIGFENVPLGYLDRIYVADTGGTVWRFDVADSSGASGEAPKYVITKLASIAVGPQSGVHAARDYRKFLYSPDVVYGADASGAIYDAVLLGSGDREHPFDMVVHNRFYMFKDRNVGSLTEVEVPLGSQPTPPAGVIVDTSSSTDLFDVTNNCLQVAANCDSGQTQDAARIDLGNADGWKLDYSLTGEKTVASATTAAGTVIFNTHEPKDDGLNNGPQGVCTSALGTARQYGLNYQDATAMDLFEGMPSQYVSGDGRSAVFAGGGYLPTPVPVVVQIDGYYQTVCSGVQCTNPGGLKLQSRIRTYWYRKGD